MKKTGLYIGLCLALGLMSCANRGIGPQGGPKDSIPPHVLRETPENGSVRFSAKTIEVLFDEYIQLDNVQSKLMVSPPQQQPPEVKAIGKRMLVTLQEDLQDSTTYTLDFGSAICDFNERNPLRNYYYSFSTGDYIDSLEIGGVLYNAENLNYVSGVLVGIHRDLSDSALLTTPFTRIARTDSVGGFTIHNIHSGTYRVYALDDISKDYVYQPGEALAIMDSTVTPEMIREMVADTIWRDTLVLDSLLFDSLRLDSLDLQLDSLGLPLDSATRAALTRHVVDSIRMVERVYVGPGDLVLWYFSENKQRCYFKRAFRDVAHQVRLLFAAPQDSMPEFRFLSPHQIDSTLSDSAWVDPMPYTRWQVSQGRDTIVAWFTDSIAIAQDSMWIEMRYQKSDSVYNLQWTTDTLTCIYRAPRLTAKALEAERRKWQSRRLDLKSNAREKFDVYDTLRLSFAYPIDSICLDSISLMTMAEGDTVYLDFQLVPRDSSGINYQILADLKYGTSYVLQLQKNAFVDIYGAGNDARQLRLALKTAEDYSILRVHMVHFDPQARIQLLDEKDQVVRELPAEEEAAVFSFITPGTYYLRLYLDENADGRWTTGDLATKRQPERVFYHSQKLQTRANWEFDEDFDHLAVPQHDSKPKELRKEEGNKKKK